MTTGSPPHNRIGRGHDWEPTGEPRVGGMAERMRVLRIIARMNVGGPALQVTSLVERLDPSEFETKLLVGLVGPTEADYRALRSPQTVAREVRGLGRSVHAIDDARALASLISEMRRFRPHIVHTHTAKAGALGRVAARACGVPATVHTFHGHLLTGYFSTSGTRVVVGTERVLGRMTTRLVSVGSRVRDELLAAGIGHPDRFVNVPPGVTLPPVPERGQARCLLGLPPDGALVAFVGRLTPVKRPDRFLEVAKVLAQRDPDVRFVIVGDGELADQIRTDGRELGSRLTFLGWQGEMEVVYGAADVVLLTSDNEGMPVSLIEAAMAARPVVATDVGSTSEVVLDGRTGLLTSTAVDDLASAAERLIRDRTLREELGRSAAVRAHREFSTDRLVSDTAQLYRDIDHELGLRSYDRTRRVRRPAAGHVMGRRMQPSERSS